MSIHKDEEPAGKPAQMRFRLVLLEDDTPVLEMIFPVTDNEAKFTLSGPNLESFYLRLRDFMENKGGRPLYLG